MNDEFTLEPAYAEMTAAIMAALPGEWSLNNQHQWFACIARADGLAINLTFRGESAWPRSEAHTVHASLAAPKLETDKHYNASWRDYGYRLKGSDLPTPDGARMSQKRGAEAIAKDIVRRVIKPFEPSYWAAVEMAAERDTARNAQLSLIADLARIAGVELDRYSTESAGTYSFHIQANTDSASFKIQSVPAEKAKRLAAFVRELLAE